MLATRTFLFSDLRDYTRFVEQHGDVAAATLIADYRRIVQAAEVFRVLSGYWRRARATWYLGRLDAWARGLGVATDVR